DSDLENLNVIHVAGTKGKGSTCAFTRSFLDAQSKRTGYPRKIGLYTSPHLRCVQERIQINFEPLSEDLFTKYVFEVWDNLTSNASSKPRYLQLLMLVAVHAFVREGVDVAIFETHNGGEYDATNIFSRPVATGISTIGMDHIEQLGPSIENIAWHKAGIFKSGAPAFSAPQVPRVAEVLKRRASEKDVMLNFVNVYPALPASAPALKPNVQRINASVALALTSAFLKNKALVACQDLTAQDISVGIEQFFWLGRFQQMTRGSHQWFLDGAHNQLSVQNAAQWFAEVAVKNNGRSPTHVLIFSHISERDGAALLRCIANTLQMHDTAVEHLIISTYKQTVDGVSDAYRCFRQPNQQFSTGMQKEYMDAWKSILPQTQATFESTIEGAINLARSLDQGTGMQILVTGSQHLVGGALRLLESHS
ncbi:MAG: hypothetical protein Q9164_006269, partial [Protoblastenia rupestris]